MVVKIPSNVLEKTVEWLEAAEHKVVRGESTSGHAGSAALRAVCVDVVKKKVKGMRDVLLLSPGRDEMHQLSDAWMWLYEGAAEDEMRWSACAYCEGGKCEVLKKAMLEGRVLRGCWESVRLPQRRRDGTRRRWRVVMSYVEGEMSVEEVLEKKGVAVVYSSMSMSVVDAVRGGVSENGGVRESWRLAEGGRVVVNALEDGRVFEHEVSKLRRFFAVGEMSRLVVQRLVTLGTHRVDEMTLGEARRVRIESVPELMGKLVMRGLISGKPIIMEMRELRELLMRLSRAVDVSVETVRVALGTSVMSLNVGGLQLTKRMEVRGEEGEEIAYMVWLMVMAMRKGVDEMRSEEESSETGWVKMGMNLTKKGVAAGVEVAKGGANAVLATAFGEMIKVKKVWMWLKRMLGKMRVDGWEEASEEAWVETLRERVSIVRETELMKGVREMLGGVEGISWLLDEYEVEAGADGWSRIMRMVARMWGECEIKVEWLDGMLERGEIAGLVLLGKIMESKVVNWVEGGVMKVKAKLSRGNESVEEAVARMRRDWEGRKVEMMGKLMEWWRRKQVAKSFALLLVFGQGRKVQIWRNVKRWMKEDADMKRAMVEAVCNMRLGENWFEEVMERLEVKKEVWVKEEVEMEESEGGEKWVVEEREDVVRVVGVTEEDELRELIAQTARNRVGDEPRVIDVREESVAMRVEEAFGEEFMRVREGDVIEEQWRTEVTAVVEAAASFKVLVPRQLRDAVGRNMERFMGTDVVILGAPKAGKSAVMLKMADERDLVVVPGRVLAEELTAKFACKGIHAPQVRTQHTAFTARPKGGRTGEWETESKPAARFRRVWIDEAFTLGLAHVEMLGHLGRESVAMGDEGQVGAVFEEQEGRRGFDWRDTWVKAVFRVGGSFMAYEQLCLYNASLERQGMEVRKLFCFGEVRNTVVAREVSSGKVEKTYVFTREAEAVSAGRLTAHKGQGTRVDRGDVLVGEGQMRFWLENGGHWRVAVTRVSGRLELIGGDEEMEMVPGLVKARNGMAGDADMWDDAWEKVVKEKVMVEEARLGMMRWGELGVAEKEKVVKEKARQWGEKVEVADEMEKCVVEEMNMGDVGEKGLRMDLGKWMEEEFTNGTEKKTGAHLLFALGSRHGKVVKGFKSRKSAVEIVRLMLKPESERVYVSEGVKKTKSQRMQGVIESLVGVSPIVRQVVKPTFKVYDTVKVDKSQLITMHSKLVCMAWSDVVERVMTFLRLNVREGWLVDAGLTGEELVAWVTERGEEMKRKGREWRYYDIVGQDANHRDFHRRVMEELMKAAGVDAARARKWYEEEKGYRVKDVKGRYGLDIDATLGSGFQWTLCLNIIMNLTSVIVMNVDALPDVLVVKGDNVLVDKDLVMSGGDWNVVYEKEGKDGVAMFCGRVMGGVCVRNMGRKVEKLVELRRKVRRESGTVEEVLRSVDEMVGEMLELGEENYVEVLERSGMVKMGEGSKVMVRFWKRLASVLEECVGREVSGRRKEERSDAVRKIDVVETRVKCLEGCVRSGMFVMSQDEVVRALWRASAGEKQVEVVKKAVLREGGKVWETNESRKKWMMGENGGRGIWKLLGKEAREEYMEGRWGMVVWSDHVMMLGKDAKGVEENRGLSTLKMMGDRERKKDFVGLNEMRMEEE